MRSSSASVHAMRTDAGSRNSIVRTNIPTPRRPGGTTRSTTARRGTIRTSCPTTSPVCSRTVIHLEHGRSFVIEAPGTSAANLYVQLAELNGKPLNRAWLTHEEVADGGRLVLHVGPSPSKWATTAPRPPQVVGLAR